MEVQKKALQSGQEAKISISIKNAKVFCEISGNREVLIMALATLLTDNSHENYDNFKLLIEEAHRAILLDTLIRKNQEEKLLLLPLKKEKRLLN